MNKLLFSCLAAFSAACAFAGIAQDATAPCVWTNATGGTFNYRFHAPANVVPGKTYPLVLFLHGAGERGSDNVAQLKWSCDEIVQWFRDSKEEFYLVAGQVPNGKRWVEVDWDQVEHAMPRDPSESMANLLRASLRKVSRRSDQAAESGTRPCSQSSSLAPSSS